MPAIITESVLLPTTSQVEQNNFLRQALTDAGFTANNFDTYGSDSDRYFVIEHVWNPNLARGKTYLRLRSWQYSAAHKSLYLSMSDAWNAATDLGTGQLTDLDIRNGVADIFATGGGSFLYPLRAYSINHPEIRGFILQQEDRFSSLFFLRPANIFPDFGYDDINYPWGFITNDLKFAYGSNINPFNINAMRFQLEQWSQLSNPLSNGSRQVVPSPRLFLPSGVNYGAAGWFSEDVALVASNNLPMLATITDNEKTYRLISTGTSSGVAIAV